MIFSCDIHNDVKPGRRLNTKWVSEDPEIFFIVAEDNNYYTCLGTLKDSDKIYNINMSFDYGKDVNIIDYDVLKENNFVLKEEHILAKATCTFAKENCEIKITKSSLDSIEVGDKITFNLVEELPEWATKGTETGDESNSLSTNQETD